jgi:hypothetical protein
MFLVGIVLMGLGSIYIWKPTLFRRGIWLRTSVAIRLLSEQNYVRYMRGLGAVLVVIGLALVLYSLFVDMRLSG